LVGEGHPVGLAQRGRAAGVHPAAAQGIEEVAHVQPLPDVVRGVQFAPRVQREAVTGDDLGGQRNVRGDHQVPGLRLLHDVVVGDVEAGPDLHRAHVRRARHLDGLVGHQRHPHRHALRGPEQDFLDHVRAGVGSARCGAGSRRVC
jgi:hypothetical protein